MTSHNTAHNSFGGSMSQDVDARDIEKGDYYRAVNVRNVPGLLPDGGTYNKIVNIEGNTKVPFPPIEAFGGTVIGAVEDKICNSIVYFVYDLRGHWILRYYPEPRNPLQPNGRVIQVLRHSVLNFEITRLINGAKIIDGKHLYWTDGTTRNGKEIEGRHPRHIDMEMAIWEGKHGQYELYWDDDSFATIGAEVYYRILDPYTYGTITGQTLLWTQTGDPIQTSVAQLAAALTGLGCNVEICHNKLIVTYFVPEQVFYVYNLGNTFHWVSINHYPNYPLSLPEQYTTLYKISPLASPLITFVKDAIISGQTKVWGESFQFCYRYLYWNGVKSVWSPISYVPTNFGFNIDDYIWGNDREFNKIRIELQDSNLDSAAFKTFCRSVEIAVRYGETQPFYSVKIIEIADIGVATHTTDFFNDRIMSVLPSDDNTSADIQVLKNFDKIPRITNAIESVIDNKGNQTLVLSGNLDGFDMPDCVDVEIEVIDGIDESPNTTEQTSGNKGLKTRGVYKAGAVFEDEYGRQSSVYELGRIRIPYDPPTGGLRFTFANPTIVDWAKVMRIVLTKNQNQARYVQIPAIEVRFFEYNAAMNELAYVGYGDLNTAYVGFKFNVDANEEGDISTFFDRKTPQAGFQVAEGDFIQLVHTDTSPSSIPDFEVENHPVAGYCIGDPVNTGSDEYYWVFIKWNTSMINYSLVITAETYILCEIYTPLTVQDDLYYEVPDLVAYDSGGDFSSLVLTMTDRGDTYFLAKRFFWNVPGPDINETIEFERATLYDHKDTKGGDWGRPHVPDPDYKEIYRYNENRYSDSYIPDSAVNGLHSYQSLNFFTIDRQHGPIQRAFFYGDTLNLICRHRIQPVYVGSDRLIQRDGQNMNVAAAGFNVGNALMQGWGTQNPESVVFFDGYIYGWDRQSAVFWRKSNEGLVSVSEIKMQTSFNTVGKIHQALNEVFSRCYVGIDRLHKVVMVTFVNAANYIGGTTQFFNEKRGWIGYASFLPEMYGWIGNVFVTFKAGRIWEHNRDTADDCNFYATQTDASLTFVMNENSNVEKNIWNIKVHSKFPVHIPLIYTPASELHPNTQQSRIKVNNFVKKEGVYRADFMRNMLDDSPQFAAIPDIDDRYAAAVTRGEILSSQAFFIEIQFEDSSVTNELRGTDIEYSLSHSVV